MINNSSNIVSKIGLPDKNELAIFEVRKIIRCKSDNSYTEFLIIDDSGKRKEYLKRVVSKGIYHFEDLLLATGTFFRIHNQHIINVNYLRKIVRNNGSSVIMDDGTNELIPIARARKDHFFNYLKKKGIII